MKGRLAHQLARQRGLGVADMALALRDGRPRRANGDLAYHVLDIMHAMTPRMRGGTLN